VTAAACLQKADGTDDEYEASLYLTDISTSRLGVYRLTASNAVGASEEMIEVRMRRDKSNVREREHVHRVRGQPITAGGHAASSECEGLRICNVGAESCFLK